MGLGTPQKAPHYCLWLTVYSVASNGEQNVVLCLETPTVKSLCQTY